MIAPVLLFAVHDTGALEVLTPWYPYVTFSLGALSAADGRRLVVDEDRATIRCANGGATYGLGPVNERFGVRGARLLRSWPAAGPPGAGVDAEPGRSRVFPAGGCPSLPSLPGADPEPVQGVPGVPPRYGDLS